MKNDRILERPQIHGHRGARGWRPENTLDGILFAIQCGADAVEVDLCFSEDNIIVIHHDLMLFPDTTTIKDNVWNLTSIPIRSLDFAQLTQYSVGKLRPGSDYAAQFPLQVSVPSARIPSLDQAIELILDQGADDFIFNLELKSNPDNPRLTPNPEQYIRQVLATINRYDIAHRTFIQSFDWRLTTLIQQNCPDILTGVLTSMQPDSNPFMPISGFPGPRTNGLDLADFNESVPRMVAATGAGVWSSNFADLTSKLVKEAKSLGLAINAWTVNSIPDLEKMIDWGVDSITTDYPDRLGNLLGIKIAH